MIKIFQVKRVLGILDIFLKSVLKKTGRTIVNDSARQ